MKMVIFAILFSTTGKLTFAKDIFYKSGEVIILPISDSGLVLSFDATVSSHTYSKSYTLTPTKGEKEKDYSQIRVTPSKASENDKITLSLSNRESITIDLAYIGSNDFIKAEVFHTLMKKVEFKEDEFQKDNKEAIKLISCMIKREYCNNYKSKNVNIQIKDGNPPVWTTTRAIYFGRNFNGYIFEINNRDKKTYTLDYNMFSVSRPNRSVVSYFTSLELAENTSQFLFVVATSDTSIKDFMISYGEM